MERQITLPDAVQSISDTNSFVDFNETVATFLHPLRVGFSALSESIQNIDQHIQKDDEGIHFIVPDKVPKDKIIHALNTQMTKDAHYDYLTKPEYRIVREEKHWKITLK